MESIITLFQTAQRPMSAQTVTKKLKLNKSQTKMIKSMLDRYVREGKLIRERDRYFMPQQSNLLEGTVASTFSGADFFTSPELEEDLKITHSLDFCAMNKDRVLVRKKGGKCEIVRILERGNKELVGTLMRDGEIFYLQPDDRKIHFGFLVPKSERKKAKVGDKIVCEITSYPTQKADGVCKICENLGSSENDDSAILSVIRSYGVKETFPDGVIESADSIPDTISEAQLAGHLDLRKLTVITIDGDDSKDLDDAVSLEITDKGDFLLGVHIADVSHYVKQDSPLDAEAKQRATSVYVPGTVYPMLPKKLSNGICSLNEGEDRLTLSCFMIITRQGNIIESSIQPSVIRSKHRMTYNVVTEILEKSDSPKRKEYKDIFGMLVLMKDLATILSKTAKARGSIDFDLPEAKITLDGNGFPAKIEKYEVGISNKIIEQFMLAANQTVATFMKNKNLPCLYRVHQPPEKKKLDTFLDLIHVFGYTLPENPKPSDFQTLLKKIEGTQEENLIDKTMLRSMSKAKYKSTCDGHFGLAYENYLHFTSPIRRYPDLTVHRSLHMYFEKNFKALEKYREQMDHLGELCTSQEINAANCERDVDDIRKAQYMGKHIGEEFEGIISGVQAYGLFVELENTCEGFIPVETMDGYYSYDEARFSLFDKDKRFSLGDRVKIRVFSVSIPDGRTEFTLLT